MDGLIYVDKKVGVTSYDAIKLVKRFYHTNKVGHCGTLDPFASGLLIIGVNKATKIMSFLEHDIKEYEATLTLGSATDTYDVTGKVIENKEINPINKELIEDVFKSFIGEIKQTPPIYSSIHVNGKHLYEYARENIQVEVASRIVNIYDLKLLDFTNNTISFYVKCSRGTYIRSLGVDIANKLNNLGYLSSLRRISIGNINVSNASSYESLKEGIFNLIPISKALTFPKINISDEKLLVRIYNGQEIKLDINEPYILLLDDNIEIAIYYLKDATYYCYRGLFNEDIRIARLNKLQRK